jgi:hypothetical protein
MGLAERGWYGVDRIGPAQDRNKWGDLLNVVLNLWVPENAGNLPSDCMAGGLSSCSQLYRVQEPSAKRSRKRNMTGHSYDFLQDKLYGSVFKMTSF